MVDLAASLRQHARVGLDTSVFIYHIDGSSRYASPAGAALEDLARGTTAFLTNDRGLRRVGEFETLLLEDFVQA